MLTLPVAWTRRQRVGSVEHPLADQTTRPRSGLEQSRTMSLITVDFADMAPCLIADRNYSYQLLGTAGRTALTRSIEHQSFGSRHELLADSCAVQCVYAARMGKPKGTGSVDQTDTVYPRITIREEDSYPTRRSGMAG